MKTYCSCLPFLALLLLVCNPGVAEEVAVQDLERKLSDQDGEIESGSIGQAELTLLHFARWKSLLSRERNAAIAATRS